VAAQVSSEAAICPFHRTNNSILISNKDYPACFLIKNILFSSMSTADLIYEKAKILPDKLQSEALGFVEYLGRRRAAKTEVAKWQHLARETQSLPVVEGVSDDDIVAEVAAYRVGK
jgi:hypothetical protein